jgi:hypothetical protein
MASHEPGNGSSLRGANPVFITARDKLIGEVREIADGAERIR